MTDEQQYKAGFLLKCADDGLTLGETLARARLAILMRKQAFDPIGATAGLVGRGISAVPSLLSAGSILGVGLPLAAGAGAGYGAAKLTDGGREDVEEAKQDEIEGEYYRLADEARRNAARKQLSSLTGRKVKLVGPNIS